MHFFQNQPQQNIACLSITPLKYYTPPVSVPDRQDPEKGEYNIMFMSGKASNFLLQKNLIYQFQYFPHTQKSGDRHYCLIIKTDCRTSPLICMKNTPEDNPLRLISSFSVRISLSKITLPYSSTILTVLPSAPLIFI